MKYYWDKFELARTVKLPGVSLINITSNLPDVLAGRLTFTAVAREHDAVYCDWEGQQYYSVLAQASRWNGCFLFLWNGA